jgi:hypothetical protein
VIQRLPAPVGGDDHEPCQGLHQHEDGEGDGDRQPNRLHANEDAAHQQRGYRREAHAGGGIVVSRTHLLRADAVLQLDVSQVVVR